MSQRSIAAALLVTLLLSLAPPLAAGHLVQDLPDSVPVPALLPEDVAVPRDAVPDAVPVPDPLPEDDGPLPGEVPVPKDQLPGSVPVPGLLPDHVDSPVPPMPRELPEALAPACALAPETCLGIEDAMGDVRRLGVPDGQEHHEPEEMAAEMEHALRDHVVYGACQDAKGACAPVERVLGGEAPVNALSLTSPKAHQGANTGDAVVIAWDAAAVDHAQSGAVFRAQVRALEGPGAWTDVPGYRCSTDEADAFPAGSCRVAWTPAATGPHAVRVVYVAGADDSLPLCLAGTNCDLVAPFHVDDLAPAVSLACVARSNDTCAGPAAGLNLTALSVSAAGSDDQGLARLSVTASGARGSASCDVYAGTPVKDVAVLDLTCPLDLVPLLPEPAAPGAYSGYVDLVVEAVDAAGNVGRSAPARHAVDTFPGEVVVVQPVHRPDLLQQNGRAVNVSFKATYASPASRAGQPAVGEAFTLLRDGAVVCSGTTGPTGAVDCVLTGAQGRRAFTASVASRPGLVGVPQSFTVVWTELVVARAAAQDQPAPTRWTNVHEAYRAAYRVTFRHDGAPVAGAVVALRPPTGSASYEATDADGYVLVPVLQHAAGNVSYAPSAQHAGLSGADGPLVLTWSRIVVANLAADDAFVNANDTVTFTANAAYEHDASRRVQAATLALGPNGAGCVLAEGSVVNGALRAAVRCPGVRSAPLSLRVAASDTAVTQLAAPVDLLAVWTRVNVTGVAVEKAFLNLNDTANVTATATYAHDGSPVASGTVGLGPGAPAECAASSGVVAAGALTVKLRCAGVVDAGLFGLPLALGTDKGVTSLLAPASAKAVWTSVAFSNVTVDDAFVAVGDVVTATALARYAHNPALPVANATLQFAGTPVGCTFLSGGIAAGVAKARITCSTVKNLTMNGIPLAIASSESGVTAMNTSFRPRAIWTQVDFGPATLSDDFVNANDWVRVEANATYAHDGSPVPNATLVLAPGGPADCVMLGGGLLQGRLAATLRCSEVHDLRAAPLALVLSSAYQDVTRSNGLVNASVVWTRVQVSQARVDDAFTNVSSPVTLTARATYAHDGSPVGVGSLALGNASLPCFLYSGTVSNGNLSVMATCERAHNASGAGLPLLVSGTDKGVTNLTQPVDLRAVWTAIDVAYTLDVGKTTLGAGAAVVVSVNLTYAHDGTPVRRGIATVRGSDGDEQQCQANATGQCTLEVFRDLGAVTFNVTGASSHDSAVLVPDVTGQARVVPGFAKRWTAIGFTAFECRAAADPSASTQPCDGAAFPKGTQVLVRTRAVAADTASGFLAGATVRIDGEQLTTDQDGWASKVVVRTTPGGKAVLARGISASINGEAITATVLRTETLGFE